MTRDTATEADKPASEVGDASPRSALYRAVWRWHFYAGLFSIPILVILSISGIVYLFRPEITELVYGNLTNVERGQQAVSYEQQLQAVQTAYPNAEVVRMTTPSSATKATSFDLTTGGALPGFASGNYTAFVDPYTGEVLGTRNNHKDPVQIANEIHGSLLTRLWLGDPKWGDRLVELVASWTVVLVVTGVYLWWPRGASQQLKGTVLPRLRARNSRVKWRDIHAVTGVLFSFVFLFFLVTGLAWTGLWGANYQKLMTSAGADTVFTAINEPPTSQTLGQQFGEGRVGWAVSTLPVLPSGQPVGEGTTSDGNLTWNPADGAPLDAIVAAAQREGVPAGFRVSFPSDDQGSYFIGYGFAKGQGAFDSQSVYVDQYSGEVLAKVGFSDFGLQAQMMDAGIALHEGDEFGLIGQLMSLTGALAVLLVLSSSVVMWYKRRPQGLGAPRRVTSPTVAAGFVALTVSLGVIFPLVGLTMVGLFVFDFLFLRNIPPLARALNV